MAPRTPVDSARMAWWMTAWLRGTTSPDDLLDAVLDGDAAHHVVGLPGTDEAVALMAALGTVRSLGATGAGLALPAPGQLVGLGGPATFNNLALAAGEAVVLDGAGHGLVPHRAGAGVVWQLTLAHPRQLVDIGEADRTLRLAFTATAAALADLDVARWRPEVADELMNLRHSSPYDAPPGTPADAVALAVRAEVARRVVELALVDDGGAVTAGEATAREAALMPLGRAARVALVAACSPEVWPPH